MDYVLFALATVILAIQALVFHKVRKIHLASYRLMNAANTIDRIEKETLTLYRQLQSYDCLMRLIQPARPLPVLRGYAASPDFLLAIARHALLEKPSAILECSSGSSTIVLARCCQLNGGGHVWSLEHDEHYAGLTRARLAEQGLDEWATIIHAPLTTSQRTEHPWYEIGDLAAPGSGFDMLVIDGPPLRIAPQVRYPALPKLDPLLAKGASVFLDDAGRAGEKEILRRWAAEFPQYAHTPLDLEKGGACLVKS